MRVLQTGEYFAARPSKSCSTMAVLLLVAWLTPSVL